MVYVAVVIVVSIDVCSFFSIQSIISFGAKTDGNVRHPCVRKSGGTSITAVV